MTYGMVTAGDVQALRAAGLSVHEVDGWQTRGHGPGSHVETLTFHHTAGPSTGNTPSLGTVVHGRGGSSPLPGPLCNFYVARDGSLYVVAAGLAYHAGESRQLRFTNAHALGWECEASGTRSWPAVQLAAIAKSMAVIRARKGLSVSDVRGHKETCAPVGRKIDPAVLSMTLFRALVAVQRTTPKPPPGKPKPAPVQVGLRVKVQRLQQVAGGVAVDGVWGADTDASLMALRTSCMDTPSHFRREIAAVQRALGLRPLPIPVWGGGTDTAFLALRGVSHKP